MKIKEILELTNDKNIAAIAKEQLTIGEKRARAVLKEIGCLNQTGKKGWTYEGEDPTVLEKSIYDFVTQPKASKKTIPSKSKVTNKSNSQGNSLNASKEDIMDNSKENIREENDMKAQIQALIKGTKEAPEKVYKGVYFDKEIANFLDNVQHGNRSEIINKILKQYLTENELL